MLKGLETLFMSTSSTCEPKLKPAPKPKRRAWAGCGLALLALVLAAWWRRGLDDGRLRVWLLDVGQGECIIVRWRGRTVMVDGGSSDRANVARASILPLLQMAGVRRVDALFVSHPDADHFNALPDIAREVPVARLFVTPRTLSKFRPRDDLWSRFLQDCRARGTVIQSIAAPQVLALAPDDGSSEAALPLRVLWPAARAPQVQESSNANSLVLKIERGASSVLLTGDADASVEDALCREPQAANITVLKVGHHGSRTSSTEAFLRHARPRAAMISCGRYNTFGHPSAEVLDRLGRLGIPTKRTDLDGTIEIECDGHSCQVSSFR